MFERLIVYVRQIPKSVWILLLAETCLRYGFFGLVGVFTTVAGDMRALTPTQARTCFHFFYAASWLCCILGGYVSDLPGIGKIRTAVISGILYFVGLSLLSSEALPGLFVGILLTAIGFGGMRPTISALMGDQFDSTQDHLRKAFFGWSYVATNLGALFGFLYTSRLVSKVGVINAAYILGASGLLAALLLFSFRGWFRTVPAPARDGEQDRRIALPSFGVVFCIAVFWCLYNQTHSSIVQQAKAMDRWLFGVNWNAETFQALNPLFVIFFTPLFGYLIGLSTKRGGKFGDLRQMSLGYLFVLPVILISIALQLSINSGALPSSLWLILIYFLATVAEIFLAIPSLHYFYFASNNSKGTSLGLFYASIGLGELFSTLINSGWNYFHLGANLGETGYFILLGLLGTIATTAFWRRTSTFPRAS